MTAVLVLGGGPVGLAVALGLGQRGVDVTVLERESRVNDSPRAIAYLPFVHWGFDRLGILEDLKRQAVIGDGLNFIDYVSGENFHMKLDVLEGYHSYPFVLHMGQDQIGNVILDHLTGLDNVDVRFAVDVSAIETSDSGVSVLATGADGEQRLTADWLVATDGASSTARKLLDLPFNGITWPDRFISTNIRADLMAEGLKVANWRIDPRFGAIMGKITEDNLWRFTFREAGDLPDEGLENRIHEHFASAMPGNAEYELVAFQPYRMHQRVTDSFRVGRVLLAGDAAHITNPVGGLGLTGGFLDAFVLAEALAAVVDGSADDAVLDRYSVERKRVFEELVSPTATANKKMLFDEHSPAEKEALLGRLRALATDDELRRTVLLADNAMATLTVL